MQSQQCTCDVGLRSQPPVPGALLPPPVNGSGGGMVSLSKFRPPALPALGLTCSTTQGGSSIAAGPASRLSYKYSDRGSLLLKKSGVRIGRSGLRAGPSSPSRSHFSFPSDPGDIARAIQNLPENIVRLGGVGHGASGTVSRAIHSRSLLLLAVKDVPVHDRGQRQQIGAEIRALISSRSALTAEGVGSAHTSVVSFYDAYTAADSGTVSIVMEYCPGGSLQDLLSAVGPLDEITISSIAHDALSGLSYIHGLNLLHRDIKPSNMLLDGQGNIKLADFGLVRDLSRGARGKSPEKCAVRVKGGSNKAGGGSPSAHTFVGTAIYMSPERLQGKPYSFSSDVWSLGLSLLTLALGKFPLDVPKNNLYWNLIKLLCPAHHRRVSSGASASVRSEEEESQPDPIDIFLTPECSALMSDGFKDLISKCLCRNPADRPSVSELLQHSFVQMSPSRLGRQLGMGAGIGHDMDRQSPGSSLAEEEDPRPKDSRRMSEEERLQELRWVCRRVCRFQADQQRGSLLQAEKSGLAPVLEMSARLSLAPELEEGAIPRLASQLGVVPEMAEGIMADEWGKVLAGDEAASDDDDDGDDDPHSSR
jgi:serine/threonine protein kinase